MSQSTSATGPAASATLRSFDGYPYLVTYIVPAFYHLMLLPAEASREWLEEFAAQQAWVNALRSCLVYGPNECVYFPGVRGGEPSRSAEPPASSLWATDRLLPVRQFEATAEFRARRVRLDAFLGECPMNGWIMGAPNKGGRKATASDLLRLSRPTATGVPRGLERCPVCGDQRGECLDPNSRLGNLVVPVHCLCDADNRCGACGGLLGERKLNGNQYDPSDGGIWHLGAFAAFSHRCQQTNTRNGAGLFAGLSKEVPRD